MHCNMIGKTRALSVRVYLYFRAETEMALMGEMGYMRVGLDNVVKIIKRAPEERRDGNC
jgi:hypothetical protein